MSKILDYIEEDAEERLEDMMRARNILDSGGALKAPDEFNNYGYNLSNTIIARYKPWDEYDMPISSSLNDEALFNIRQFNAMAPEGIGYELGVYNGGVSRMLMDEGRPMICFDTFTGVSGSGDYDMMEDGEYCCRDPEIVKNFLHDAVIVEGDVRDTLARRQYENVAFAHLDMDVYEPTEFALNEIWPRLMFGGVIVCDDYGVWCTHGIRLAVDDFITEHPMCKHIYLQTGQMVLIK